jgi:cell wall-associated NlpC family hydrolase
MPFYIQVPVANMHRSEDLRGEVISQALYSEEVALLQKNLRSCLIQTDDGYRGFVQPQALLEREPLQWNTQTGSLFNHIYSVKDTTPYPPLLTLPFSCKLRVEISDERWLRTTLLDGKEAYIQQGDLLKHPPDIFTLGKKFLGLPYTWGGKSSFGFDCSGLMQTLFRFKGMILPRDAKDQAVDPRLITISKEEAQRGDLIFFGRQIFHVGLIVDQDQFLHATVARMSTQTVLHTLKEIYETEAFSTLVFKRVKNSHL